MIEVLDAEKVSQAKFEAQGGPMGMLAGAVMHTLTWLSIGALFHLGWRIAG